MAKKPKIPTEIKVALPKSEPVNESPKERSVNDIQKEYTGLALRVGQLQYQIYTFNKDMEQLNGQMRNLNFEAAAAQARDAAKAAKVAKDNLDKSNG